MTEWLREGIEGRSLKATLRLYLLGLIVLAPAAAALALVFGGQASFVATPVLVSILVAVELAVCHRAKLRKDLRELLRKLRLRIEYRRDRIENYTATIIIAPSLVRDVSLIIGCPLEHVDELVHRALYESDSSIRASAVEDLRFINDPRAVNLLIGALQDKDPSVRRSAVVGLMEIGDLMTLEPLNRALVEDEDESVRSAAHDAVMDIMSRAPSKNRDASTQKPSESVRKRA